MAYIEAHGLSKSFGSPSRHVLDRVSLTVDKGEFVSIVGFMGCGKSTLLNLLAGVTEPDAGTITIDSRPLGGIARQASIVFQNYSLLPWFSALENVRLAVDAARPEWSRTEQKQQAERYLRLVGLGNAIHRRPSQLSGGMRQRVAIARAFATDPEILFLDEPFGALDALTRGSLQQELARLCSEAGRPVTTVMITNNIDEALLLSDRIVPMTKGPARHARIVRRRRSGEAPKPRSARARRAGHSCQGPRRRVPVGSPARVTVAPRPQAAGAAAGILACRGQRGGGMSLIVPLELTGLTKVFPTEAGPFVAVKNVNVRIQKSEFICIVGHSGCGKSTVLSIIAGLQRATEGGVVINGKQTLEPGADRAVVFQTPSLLPWLTARQNVELAVQQKFSALKASKRRAHALKYLALTGVADAADQLPAEMSLGMQQCVSLARALSLEPELLLLDEPFSMLDSLTRLDLQDTLLRRVGAGSEDRRHGHARRR